MLKKSEVKPYRNSDYENGTIMGNRLMSGKWIWVHYQNATEGGHNDLHRFKVTFLTPKGTIETCLAHSSSTDDIKKAMALVS